jgi:glycosyltransferase involved in cell wall biosynthesis
MILRSSKISYISRSKSIHDERFINTIKSKFNVGEFFLESSATQSLSHVLKDSKVIIASPLTSGVSLIPQTSELPIVGVCMAFEINEDSKNYKVHKQLIKNISRCDAIICDSNYIGKIIRENFRFNGELLSIVYGCNQKIFLKVEFKNHHNLRIISTRNWTKVHSNQIMIDALQILDNMGVSFQANLFGTGEELSEEVHSKVAEIGFDKVLLRGNYLNSNLPQLFENHEIYISSAISDGTSISLIEALSAGRICVCRDFASNREWIKHGVTGFLFKNLNHLVEILLTLNSMNFIQREKISIEARNSVLERGNWKSYEPKFLDLISRYSN